MNLSLPFPYACSVTMRDGSRHEARRLGRVEVTIPRLSDAEAPVALRWGDRDASREGWTHTRYAAGGHMLPLGVPGEDARIACARAVGDGWEGVPAAPPPRGPCLRDDDPFVARVGSEDRSARASAMTERASRLRLVGGRVYAPCPEPVAIEVAPGLLEIRIGRGVDWLGAHPILGLRPDILGSRLLQGHEILLPGALAIDSSGVAQRVVRKALIVLRKACESNLDARRRAAEAEASLTRGQCRMAAEAMSACLAALAPTVPAHPGLREFIARTDGYLDGYLAAA